MFMVGPTCTKCLWSAVLLLKALPTEMQQLHAMAVVNRFHTTRFIVCCCV